MRRSRMYYIWCDESDKEGEFYSNFYGGLLIESKNLKRVLNRMEQKIVELDITEEIKWQKVNQHFFEKYMVLVDFIFDLLEEGLVKIRIFFRHNQYVPKYLTREQMRKEYSMLYYQFIKHAFGFQYSNGSGHPVSLHIALDELPISEPEKKEFKHKLKVEGSNRRGKRTVLKEKLYKQIYFRISQLRHGFNIGMSTGLSSPIEIWTMPYRHWSFVPKIVEVDKRKTKKGRK